MDDLEQRAEALLMKPTEYGQVTLANLLAFAREERARGMDRAIELCGEPDCPACERIRVEAHAERGGGDGR